MTDEKKSAIEQLLKVHPKSRTEQTNAILELAEKVELIIETQTAAKNNQLTFAQVTEMLEPIVKKLEALEVQRETDLKMVYDVVEAKIARLYGVAALDRKTTDSRTIVELPDDALKALLATKIGYEVVVDQTDEKTFELGYKIGSVTFIHQKKESK